MLKKTLFVFVLVAIGCTKAFSQTEKGINDTTISIKVKGVTCSNDLKTLANNVKELKGVSNCTPGKMGPVSVFKISFNTILISTKEIFKAIENTGGCSDPNEKPYKVKTN